MTWYVGDTIVAQAVFREVPPYTGGQGDLADPTSVEVRLRDPSGNVTTVTSPDASITNPAVGYWRYTFDADEAGRWHLYIAGSGGGADAVHQVTFDVRAPKMSLA